MGMVSFISTVPSLVSLIPSPSGAASKCFPRHSSTINCKIEAELDHEDRLSRRHVLHCFSATIGMDLIARSSSLSEVANAADLIQRRQRSEFQSKIKGTLATALKGNPELTPAILTLALNDAVTYDKATKSGGPNGSVRFRGTLQISVVPSFSEDISVTVSIMLNVTIFAQIAVKSTFLSSAIRKCGGNEEKGTLLYSAYGSSGQWGLFDKQFGRLDAEQPDPEGRVPQWDKSSVVEMKNKFSAIGFGAPPASCHVCILGSDQSTTEALLASDPEVLPWVQKYQRSRETVSQTDYEVDLITTMTKLSSLGQQINYEAYTYPVQKVDFSKLKL
ncbi:UNVERIFIED_CONTAM: Thylakoid lumenal protein, chloroplastic [Sesamum radiatum]|uniref:Thylakoid lumenal protein, chloroplastic n=1 Tax=Sesamum radiatum TaxID=300843 RepID=A0AAW2Q1Q0_SESRA